MTQTQTLRLLCVVLMRMASSPFLRLRVLLGRAFLILEVLLPVRVSKPLLRPFLVAVFFQFLTFFWCQWFPA